MASWSRVPAALKTWVRRHRSLNHGRPVRVRGHWRWSGPYAEQIYDADLRWRAARSRSEDRERIDRIAARFN